MGRTLPSQCSTSPAPVILHEATLGMRLEAPLGILGSLTHESHWNAKNCIGNSVWSHLASGFKNMAPGSNSTFVGLGKPLVVRTR